MKSIIYLVVFILCYIISNFSYSQFRYAPLELGNVWVYQVYDGTLRRAEIVDTAVIIDSTKYFGYGIAHNSYVSGFIRLREDSFYVSKEDSTFPEPLNEYKYYKKNTRLGDGWIVNFAVYTIIDTFLSVVFDSLVTVKMLNENLGLVEWNYLWTEEFGQLSQLNWLGEVQYYLKGCVINGKAYGDTTFITVSVENEFESPSLFYLGQNFPNPFNSSTTINFRLPEENNAVLELYNVLGQKIKVLLNGFISAGKHSFQLNAEGFPSGTYYYVLRTPDYTETKKMLLIR